MEEHSESSSKAVRQAEADRRSILSANVRAAHDAEPGSLLASSSGLARAVEQRRGPRNAYAAVKGPAHQTSAGSAHPTRADEQDKGSSETQSSSSGGGVAASPGLASALDGRPSAAQSLGVLTAPSIVRQSHPAASKVPYATRQGSLRTYFTSFNSLYAPLLPPSPTSKERSPSSVQRAAALLKRVIHRMASEDALASESKIFKMSNTNPMTYRNSVRTDLVGIARRQKEDRLALSDNKTCIGQLGIDIFQRATSLNDEGNVLDEHGKKKIIEKLEEDLISLLRQSELIGTPEEVKVKLALLQERKQGRLDVERLEKAGMLSSKETLKQSDYPWPEAREGESAQLADEELSSDTQDLILQHWGMGGTQPDLVGHETNCERCGNRFVVKPIEPDSADTEACSFHWGKRRFVRDGGGMRGPRVPRWTCCNALDEGSAFSASSLTSVAKEAGFAAASSGSSAAAQGTGCIKGPHVFKEEQANLLHRRAAFLSTEALLSQPPKAEQRGSQGGKHQILAFDCELIYTTAGMSLARLTVLDESGKSVLDRYVRPRAAILDYNTRFSGIKPGDLPARDDYEHTLEGAREALGQLMSTNTVLIGHGLENDLRAVRLIHMRAADSALLFPHAKGLPFRMSLRELARVHLGRYIQNDDADCGHDAEEDARAALDLVRSKYRELVSVPSQVSERTQGGSKSLPSTSGTPMPPSPTTSATTANWAAPYAGPRSSVSQNAVPSAGATSSLFLPRARRK